MEVKRWTGKISLLVTLSFGAFWPGDVVADTSAKSSLQQSSEGEEELKPRSSKHAGWGFTPLPVFGTAPETKIILGGMAIVQYQPKNLELRRQTVRTELIFSTSGMVNINARTEAYFFQDRLFVGAGIARKYFPKLFYGIGANTSLDNKDSYVADTWELDAMPLYSPFDNFFFGPALIAQFVKNRRIEEGGLLDTGDYIGKEGGTDIGLGYAVRYDTRDNPINPFSGERLSFSIYGHGKATGSDFGYTRMELIATKYLRTYREQVLALQFSGWARVGQAPFFNLAPLGGWKHLRGHFEGRYRDQLEFDLQAEYRVPLFWRFGGVVFAGVGDVAPNVSQFFRYGIKYSLGLGLRFMVDVSGRVNLSADYGYGGVGAGAFYIDAGEAL